MTAQLAALIQALWTEQKLTAQISVRMFAAHAAQIDASMIPTYANGGGKQRPMAVVISEAREVDPSGTHLLWYIEDSGGRLIHRAAPSA